MSSTRSIKMSVLRLHVLGITTVVAASIGALGLMPLSASAASILPSGSLEVGSPTSGNCAQVSGEVSGSTVNLDGCNKRVNQKWDIGRAGYYNGAIAYTVETYAAGSFQCMNDSTGGSAAGTLVNLANCNGLNSAERFVYVNSVNGGNELFNVASGECLDTSSLGAQLVLNPCSAGVGSQLWFLTANNAKA